MIAVERNALIALIKWAQSMPVGTDPEHEALSDAYDALEHCIIFDVGPVDPEVRAAYYAPHAERGDACPHCASAWPNRRFVMSKDGGVEHCRDAWHDQPASDTGSQSGGAP